MSNETKLADVINHLEGILKAIESCTQPVSNHTDPLSVNDCWNEVRDTIAQLKSLQDNDGWISKGIETLAELVRLKDIKDELDNADEQDQAFVNRYADYTVKKKIAWDNARAILQKLNK